MERPLRVLPRSAQHNCLSSSLTAGDLSGRRDRVTVTSPAVMPIELCDEPWREEWTWIRFVALRRSAASPEEPEARTGVGIAFQKPADTVGPYQISQITDGVSQSL